MTPSYAQHGEDRILDRILRRIGPGSRVAVEFGAGDGVTRSNTARLRDRGWRVVQFDRAPGSALVTEAVLTRANINTLVPADVDVLSIDVDGNDLWLWEALTARPRIVVIEYNQKWSADLSLTVPYVADRQWDSTDYYGASVGALYKLARRKGYRLAKFTRSNLIFVQRAYWSGGYRPFHVPVPRLGKPPDPQGRPWVAYR
jgi:hypothetical protein